MLVYIPAPWILWAIEPEIFEMSEISSFFEAMDDQQFLRGRSPRRSYGSDIARLFSAFLGRGFFWVNYNELTTSSLEIIVSKGNHPQMALIQVSELL